jgi:hypothetical protein
MKNINSKIVTYYPLSEDGTNLILINDNNIKLNETGFTAFCVEVKDDIVELLLGDGTVFGKIEGIKKCSDLSPDYIYRDLVETINGTYRKGIIYELFYHLKDEEYKYFIKDEKGKKIKRMYSAADLIKILK